MNLKVIQTQIQPWTVAQGTTDTPRQGGWHPAVCLIRPAGRNFPLSGDGSVLREGIHGRLPRSGGI